ncbi:MAG TPA: Bax inhibitor-1 family protein [Candidatus Aquilonibacter sp.]|nr:Bax inhibitor-1 family protein [Candidatus Aquilonibacter sp.]
MAYRFQPNPYGMPAATARPQSLLGQVLGITALGMCISALAVYLFPNVGGLSWLAFIGGFILLFAINGTRANGALSLMLFYAFTFLEGLAIAPIVTAYAHLPNGAEIVYNAALTTGLGMFALGAVVYATGLDLRRFQGWFFGALLLLVVVGIVSIFFRIVSPTVYSWLTLVIFTGLVLVDFARIRAGGDGLTPVQMAVQIYLDAVNIFLALLQIFGNRSRDD